MIKPKKEPPRQIADIIKQYCSCEDDYMQQFGMECYHAGIGDTPEDLRKANAMIAELRQLHQQALENTHHMNVHLNEKIDDLQDELNSALNNVHELEESAVRSGGLMTARITELEEGVRNSIAVYDRMIELSTVLAMLRSADATLESSTDLADRLKAQDTKKRIYAEIDKSGGEA